MNQAKRSTARLVVEVGLWIALLILVLVLARPAQGLELTPANNGPYRPWQNVKINVEGATPEQLKTAAVHYWPKETASVESAYRWDNTPYLQLQAFEKGSYWLAVCVAEEDGTLSTSEITVDVGGGGPTPDPDDDDPAPPTPPEPLSWISELREMVAAQAAKVMPGHEAEGAKWAAAIRRVAKGADKLSFLEFREALKREATEALGYSATKKWEDKFDDPILTPYVIKLISSEGLDSVVKLLPAWGAIADGLDIYAQGAAFPPVPPLTGKRVIIPFPLGENGGPGFPLYAETKTGSVIIDQNDPDVYMITFTSDNCPPCVRMRPIRDRLRAAGWKVSVLNINRPAGPNDTEYEYWMRQYRARSNATPCTFIVTGKTLMFHGDGLLTEEFLVRELTRAENFWRKARGFVAKVLPSPYPRKTLSVKTYSRMPTVDYSTNGYLQTKRNFSSPNPTRAGCGSAGCAMCGSQARGGRW